MAPFLAILQPSKIKAYQAAQAITSDATSANTIYFLGGYQGIGVTSGPEQVYLVFWGTQWGNQSRDSNGNLTFSNDSAGTLDGYTMVAGHEYAETITDQIPLSGWANYNSYEENADECAWIKPGQQGGAGNVVMGNGSYTMQSTWSNDTNRCDLSHGIIS